MPEWNIDADDRTKVARTPIRYPQSRGARRLAPARWPRARVATGGDAGSRSARHSAPGFLGDGSPLDAHAGTGSAANAQTYSDAQTRTGTDADTDADTRSGTAPDPDSGTDPHSRTGADTEPTPEPTPTPDPEPAP